MTNQDGTLDLSWDESVCATNYIVELKSKDNDIKTMNVTKNKVMIKDFDACSASEVFVTAVTYGRHKNDSLYGKFEPPTISSDQLELEISPSTYTVKAMLTGSPPCVAAYDVKLCKHESCRSIGENLINPVFEFPNLVLDPCSTYNISVRALFAAGTYRERVFQFSTLPPTVEDAKKSLLPTTEAGPEDHVTIIWNDVTCGSGYQVFYSNASSGGAWKHIGNTAALELVVRHAPCNRYGVKVVVGGNLSEIVLAKNTLEKPIEISNLTIDPSANSVEVSWDHDKCSSGYRMNFCKHGPDCFEENVTIKEANRKRISIKVENLTTYTAYTVQVSVITNSLQLEGEIKHFKTEAAKPKIINSTSNAATISAVVTVAIAVALVAVAAVRPNYFKMLRNLCWPQDRSPGDLESQTVNEHLEMEQKTFLGDQNINVPD